MREKADEGHIETINCPNGMFRILTGLKIDIKEVERRYMRESDGKLCCTEMEDQV